METHAQLNYIDYTVLGLIAFSGLIGLMRGLLREVFAMLAWVVAFIVAVKYYALAQPWTHRYIHQDDYAADAAMAVMFCIGFVVFSIVGSIVTRLIIRGTAITMLNRSLGFAFGLVRGALIVSIMFLLAQMFIWPDLDKKVAENTKPVQIDTAMPLPTPASPGEKTADEKQAAAEKPDPAYTYIMESKTRPYLAYGAHELKGVIPPDAIEKLTQQILDKGNAAKKTIEEHKQDILDSAEDNAKEITSHITAKGQ